MRKSKKLITFLLLCSMLAGTFLTACSETTSEDPANVSSEVSADAAETVLEEVEVNPLEELPVEDYGGANYHILGDTNSNWWIISLNSEEITGEIINDTVYERNQFVEERYNVNVTSQETTAAVSELQMAVQANSDDYSVVWERINTLIPTAQAGNLKNLKGFSAFNLEAPWWDVDSVKALAINDKLFFACNDINVHTMEGCSAMYFSKVLIADNQLENPYDLVREHRWTIDKMGEMMQTAASDTNGSGMRDEGDTFGLVTGIGQYLSLVNGGGVQLVILENGEEGDNFILNIASEPVIEVTEKVSSLLNDKNLTVIVNDDSWGYNSFYTDQSLFYIMQLGSVVGIRDNMENDFGILPFPMWNEEQDTYTTSMEATAQAMCIPLSVADPDMVGMVTEAMAVYSDLYLIDAYYDTTLKGKIARDQDTTEMLDILTGHRTFDYATCYGSWNVYTNYLASVQASGAENLVSLYEKISKAFTKQVEKAIEAYGNIPD